MYREAYAQFYKIIILSIRNPAELAHIFVYPLISLFSVGLFAYFISLNGGDYATVFFILIGIITWDVYSSSQRSASWPITVDIWSSSLKHTFTGSSSLVGLVIGSMIYGAFGTVSILTLLSVVGYLVFGFNILSVGILLLNFAFVFLFASGFGFIISSLMLTSGYRYMSLIWILPGIVMVFSGIYYPIEILPEAVRIISLLIPSTHSLISMRAAIGFSPELAVSEFLIGAISSVVFFVFSIVTLKYAIKRGKMSGEIAKH